MGCKPYNPYVYTAVVVSEIYFYFFIQKKCVYLDVNVVQEITFAHVRHLKFK